MVSYWTKFADGLDVVDNNKRNLGWSKYFEATGRMEGCVVFGWEKLEKDKQWRRNQELYMGHVKSEL